MTSKKETMMKKVKKNYEVVVQHYGEQAQVLDIFTSSDKAKTYLAQQAFILQGYNQRTGYIGEAFVVFGNEDIHASRLWIRSI